jgi:hypothetical protein
MRNELDYSSLTDDVFYIDVRGQKTTVHKGNFTYVILRWISKGITFKDREKFERTLFINDKTHWKITCERVTE